MLAALSVVVGGMAFRYVTGNPAGFDTLFRAKYVAHLGVVWSHGVASTLALVIGPWQFRPRLRRCAPRLHRTVGLFYMACMLVGGLSGVAMGLDAHGGLISRVGFCTMAILWMVTAGLAWQAILRRDVRNHRRWMLRNFALTFGAVMLRLYLYSLQWAGFGFDQVYPFVTWAAWLPNIALTEWYLQHPPQMPLTGSLRADRLRLVHREKQRAAGEHP